MSYPVLVFALILSVSPGCLSNVSHLVSNYHNVETTTIPSPPVPYSFHYKAGRFPGNIDRYQSETGDGTGTIYGTYSYIDPKFKIRTVDYTADQNGFHPILTNFEDVQTIPQDTDAVKLAKLNHYQLYQKIADANASPQNVYGSLPKASASVAKATQKHLDLFQKIAQEHEMIAAQREAERQAFELTSVRNDVRNIKSIIN